MANIVWLELTGSTLWQLLLSIAMTTIGYGVYRIWSVRRQYAHLPQSKSNFFFGHLPLFLGNFPFPNPKPIHESKCAKVRYI